MTKYLNFFESESGFTEAVEAGQLFYPNVSYTEEDDTVHWNLAQPADPVETPMLRMHFSTSTPGQEVNLYRNDSYSGVTAMEIDGIPVNFSSGGIYGIEEPGNHTAVYQFGSPEIPERLFFVSGEPFTAFTSAEITSAVTSIANHAFHRCTHISAVTIPDSVTTIGFQAFSVCGDLTRVTIPDSVTTIGFNAFEHAGLSSVTIPDSVTSMGGACFIGCTEMLSARIGSGITTLPSRTFDGCSSLQGVVLPGNLTVIGQEAFAGCSSLYGINIPSGVTTIGEHAFGSCTLLHDIKIPSGVTTIGERAFNRCSGLTAIYLNPETPPTLGTDALDNTNNCPIYVPAASVDTYKEAWTGYASRIMPIGGYQYSITASVNDEELGQVNLDGETALEGDQVEFEVEVYEEDVNKVASVTITDGNGDEVEYTDDGDEYWHHYSFTMPGSDVTISVVIVAKQVYSITASVNDEELGEVNGFDETVLEGRHVEFDVDVFDEDVYQISSVTVTDGNGVEIPVTDEGDTIYSFTMPASNVTIFVTFGEIQ